MKLLNAIEFVAVVGGDDLVVDAAVETTSDVVIAAELPTLEDMSAEMTVVALDTSIDAVAADLLAIEG